PCALPISHQRTPAARRRTPHQRTPHRRHGPPHQRDRRLTRPLRTRRLPGPVPPGALVGAPGPAEPPSEDLARLAALHGVATSYRPSPDRTVTASATAVTLALAALGVDTGLAPSHRPPPVRRLTASPTAVTLALAPLGVDTGTPAAVRAALPARGAALRTRLLPPTVVVRGTTTPPALAALPEGTRLHIITEDGETRTHADGLPPGVHQVTATADRKSVV